MFKKTIHFIKYNNLTVFILLGFFLVGSSVFAQTEAGQELIGSRQISYEGVDNTLLIEADLENLDMDYKIERIEQDDKYYYITYTFINLEKINNAWQYQLREKKRKISKKARIELGKYLAEELKEEYEARIKELKSEQISAKNEGETEISEVVEYNGLIGKTLEMASVVFSGYEPVKRNKIPSPSVPMLLTTSRNLVEETEDEYQNVINDLSDIFEDYVLENDPDSDNIFGVMDNCPDSYNPDQADIDGDGIGDVCDINPDSYNSDSENNNSENEETATSSEETASSTDEEIINNDPEETNEGEGTNPGVIISGNEDEPDVEIIELPSETTPDEESTATESESTEEDAISSESSSDETPIISESVLETEANRAEESN